MSFSAFAHTLAPLTNSSTRAFVVARGSGGALSPITARGLISAISFIGGLLVAKLRELCEDQRIVLVPQLTPLRQSDRSAARRIQPRKSDASRNAARPNRVRQTCRT